MKGFLFVLVLIVAGVAGGEQKSDLIEYLKL